MTDAPPRNTETGPFAPRALDPADVCTLEAASMAERLDWIRTEILPHAVETRRLADGLALELANAPGLSEKLGRLIALERDCCEGIGFERARSALPERLRLEIHGVDPDAALFRSLWLPAPDPAPDRRGACCPGC